MRRASSEDGDDDRIELMENIPWKEDEFHPSQFIHPKKKTPWKAIGYAMFLFVLGSIFLVIGTLLFTGIIKDNKNHDRSIPMLILGSMLFIPGFYHVRIAYFAYKKVPGYDFGQIPDL